MARRRLRFEPLEDRLCMAGPVLQTTFNLPSSGSWTPSPYRASPLFVDIFGTGKDDFIAVTAGAQLVAYSENSDGSASPILVYSVPNGVADIKSTPIVVTDPTTGRKDLFAAMGRDESNPGTLEDGRVFGWDLQTAKLLTGWTQGQSSGRNPLGQSGVYGALTSGVLENNGMPDIVVTSFSHDVTAFRLDGSTIWQWTNDDTILSGAVIGDIDRDGQNEVVVGGDSSSNGYYQAGGWVNVLSNTGILKWRKFIPGEVTWSSPVLADLLNNGYLDIVIGTGLNYQNANVQSPGSYPNAQVQGDLIYALGPSGSILPGWPYATTTTNSTVPHEVLAAPAVADLLGNGQLDVVALDRAGYIHVIQPNGQALPGFQGGKSLAPDLPQSVLADNYGSPTIADINGDGKPEIIAGSGPYLRAFDTSGNLISIATTNTLPGGTPEGIDTAPIIGSFDGTNSLTLALVTWNPQASNRPDQVMIFTLPPTGLLPPWPFLRRTLSGDAVMRSPAYDHLYVASAFNALLGTIPGASTLIPYDNLLDADYLTIFSTAQQIAISQTVRQAEVQRVYQAYLGRAVDPNSLTYWTNYLNTNTYRSMEIQISASAEFASRAGSNAGQEVVQLYQAIFQRTPSQSEINYWVGTRQSVGSLANVFLNSPEALHDQLSTFYVAAFGANAQNYIPADASAAYSYDIHTGVREEVILSSILGSNANYASTNFVAGYVQDLYRDIFSRMASPTEDATWVTAVDNLSVAFGNLALIFLNTTEAREDFIQSEYVAILHHGADASTLASLANYPNRETIAIDLVGSTEFYNVEGGGTASGFVAAAFLSLTSITVDQSTINSFVARMNAGLSTAGVAQQIITGGSLYYNNTSVNQLEVYLPDETLGVLRSGNLPSNAAGQPINPDPNLISYCVGLYTNGESDEQVISTLLNSPQYESRVAYDKGIYRSPGIRN